MSGFVGSRARKRRRNIFLSLVITIVIGFFVFISPTLDTNNTQIIPDENIVPDPTEDFDSLASNIEELELSLFQKDQKIKFRDGQIKNLQIQLKATTSKYDDVVLEVNKIKDDFKTLSSDSEKLVTSDKFKSLQDKFTKLNLENDKNISTIKNLNKQVDELNLIIQSADDMKDDIKNENQKLKKDNKSYFSKNLKLDSSITKLKQKITEQQIEIDSYLDQIKKLKDKSHHGG